MIIILCVVGNNTNTIVPNIPSSLALVCPEGVFCRLMCPNRPPLPVTSTDPLLWRERATLNLNLTRLMENAGPWKAAFSGYMNPLGVDQPYANWHGWGWMANEDCNSGPRTKSPPRAPTPPPELNRRSGCQWHKARPPLTNTDTHTHNIAPPLASGVYVFDMMLGIQRLKQSVYYTDRRNNPPRAYNLHTDPHVCKHIYSYTYYLLFFNISVQMFFCLFFLYFFPPCFWAFFCSK